MIAMALVTNPQLLIADEPTKGLDAVVRNQVYDTFCMVRDQYHVGFIVITHDLLLAAEVAEAQRSEGVLELLFGRRQRVVTSVEIVVHLSVCSLSAAKLVQAERNAK